MKVPKRSPLKNKPLRNPGQSLDQQISRFYDERLLPPLLVAVFLIAMAGLEWAKHVFSMPPSPIIYTLCAIAGVGYSGYTFWRSRAHIQALRLGRDGEKAVGQFLEQLRVDGYYVFHDLIGNGFNVDHVIVGRAGVFTLETKTISKRASVAAKVTFDGERVLVDGYEMERNPLVQARAQASWLREILMHSTGRNFNVRPVLLFPGWFVEQSPGNARDVWVLEPKALRAFLQHERESLGTDEIRLASFHISRFIRGIEASRPQI